MNARVQLSRLLPVAIVAGGAVASVPAHAQLTYDTLYVANSRCQPPAIAIDGFGAVHVVVPEEAAHLHFWRVGSGPWQQEVITPPVNSSYVTLAAGPANRLALLRRGAAGNLIVLRPGQQAFWDADTIPGPPTPSGSFSALQVDPITDEPVVAFVTNSGGFYRLTLARRRQAGWSTTTIDSTPAAMSQPSMALDPLGRIRLALARDVGPAGQGDGFYYAEADSMTGPFAWTRVDTLLVDDNASGNNSALLLDPLTGDPRATHGEAVGFRYASRSGGEWTSGPVRDNEFIGFSSRPLSLTLDAAGFPRILECYIVNIASGLSPADQPSCGGVATPYPIYYSRDYATGPGTFDLTYYLGNLHESGGDALATFGSTTHIVYRKSWSFQCWPAPIIHAQTTSPAAVVPASPRFATLRLGPNPIRSGATLQLRMRLDSAGPVELHLNDIAGRRIARTEHDGAPGDGEINWLIPALPAGWYRVHARQNGATIGSAPLLLVD